MSKIPKNVWKSLILIAAVVLFFTITARIFSSSETLSDYASKHPELQITEESPSTEEIISTTEPETETTTIPTEEETSVDEETTEYIDEYQDSDLRYTLAEGFFYEPIPEYIQDKIIGISYPEDASVSMNDLSYLQVQYHDFNDEIQTGELICNVKIAQDLIEIFHDLYKAGYQIDKIKLIDDYQGDDDLSILDNNTSCFNYRVVEGTSRLSKHAYGLAIDINPFYNPYITYKNGEEHISPVGSEEYADRTKSFPYKIDENDLCYKLFASHGFTWGGVWNSCKDYQHFQKEIQ